MKKKDLCCIARNAYLETSECRLNYCKAWYYIDKHTNAVALRSYSSIVAVCWNGIVWEFDSYSNTTTQHVWKFAKLMGAPVVSLYRTSGMSKRDYLRHSACDWQDVIQAASEGL